MTASPYAGKPEAAWRRITKRLVKQHPLKPEKLLDAAITAWNTLWQTTIGTGPLAIKLAELRVPASVVGYFFEVLLARELEQRFPGEWRGNQSKNEKDLVYLRRAKYSIEIKSSGQAGFKIYGNRSTGHRSENVGLVKKPEKSGYYLTVNFIDQTITLLRFGWLDVSDWKPQGPQSGQMSGLSKAVYEGKLLRISGEYRRQTPILLLDGVGDSKAQSFAALGIHRIDDLLRYTVELPPDLARIKQRNQDFLNECTNQPAH